MFGSGIELYSALVSINVRSGENFSRFEKTGAAIAAPILTTSIREVLALQQLQYPLRQLVCLGKHCRARLLKNLRPGQVCGFGRKVGIADS